MRTILNLSLPPKIAISVKKRAKQHGFSSVSEYIRFLLEMDTDLISVEDILKMGRKAEREYRSGKIKQLNSLADLL